MSKLGNIQLSYGKQFNIAVANTYSNIVLSGTNLPVNSIIISSPLNENNEDLGSYSLLATDGEGNPVRLTYCIKQGNGLYEDENNSDILYLHIDNSTIKNNENGLYIDLSVFNQDIIKSNDNILSIDTNKINTASEYNRGIISIDNNTIKTDEDTIFINTDNLNYADNNTNTYGIINSVDNVFNIKNGILSLEQKQLPHANEKKYGVVKADENTLTIEDGILKVNTQNIPHANKEEFGIISIDNKKIISKDGILRVNTDNINKASYDQKGIINIDNNSIQLNKSNQITIPKYKEIIDSLNNINDELIKIDESFEEMKNDILFQVK